MKGIIKFKDGHIEYILRHVGFKEAGLFITENTNYIRTDKSAFYRYIKDFDVFVPCVDIVTVELEEE